MTYNHCFSAALARLRTITKSRGEIGTVEERQSFAHWMGDAIANRNIAGLADPRRNNLYPVDFDALVNGHDLLGLTRPEVIDALPRLRGNTLLTVGDPMPIVAGP